MVIPILPEFLKSCALNTQFSHPNLHCLFFFSFLDSLTFLIRTPQHLGYLFKINIFNHQNTKSNVCQQLQFPEIRQVINPNDRESLLLLNNKGTISRLGAIEFEGHIVSPFSFISVRGGQTQSRNVQSDGRAQENGGTIKQM